MSETIGERLKLARERVGLTQNQVCKSLGIPKNQTLSAYERNVNNPPLETLVKLSDLYQVSIDWIVRGEGLHQSKHKTKVDYITALFEAIDKLGLDFREEDPFDLGVPSGRYVVDLTNGRLQGFSKLAATLHKLTIAKDVLDPEDYDALIARKIKKIAAESNDFEDISFDEPNF